MKSHLSPRAKRLALKILLALVAVFLLYWASVFARVVWWNHFNPDMTPFMSANLDDLREKYPNAKLRHKWVDYRHISIYLKRAVVAAEDDRFTEHDGFDWEGMGDALEKDLKRGKLEAGGSTISQQLAKNLFLSNKKSLVRKLREAAITVMIEHVWSKKRILEVYLNVAQWGEGIFGIEAAAEYYFHCHASQLSPYQSARLAVMLPAPDRYQRRYPAWLERHAVSVERRMFNSVVPK